MNDPLQDRLSSLKTLLDNTNESEVSEIMDMAGLVTNDEQDNHTLAFGFNNDWSNFNQSVWDNGY